jgi:SAM-dependent methyltransferase
VYEILDHLAGNARVLDLGSGGGSFPAQAYRFQTIRVDLTPSRNPTLFVQADAPRLPFRSRTFDAIVLNHCLEHFDALQPSLQEIGRVVKPDGGIFVSVPDAGTFTDRLYRKVFRNSGGHVNLFRSCAELERSLASYFGLPHVATRTLHSGLTFLNRRNLVGDPVVRAQTTTGGLSEPLLAGLNAALRVLDRLFRTRLSVYGWALYFGTVPEAVDTSAMINVCLRCGAGQPFTELQAPRDGGAKRSFTVYTCQSCGARNIGMPD